MATPRRARAATPDHRCSRPTTGGGFNSRPGRMRISEIPIPPEREVVYQAQMIAIAAAQTPESMAALGKRLARYKRRRIAAENEYFEWLRNQ